MTGFDWRGDQVMSEISHRIDDQAHRIGRDFVRVAQTYVHVLTGFLRNTIDYAYDSSTHSISFIVGAPYGIFEEFGTRYREAHPYIRPALNTVGTIWGFETEVLFTNVIPTDKELLFGGGRYIGGKGLTEQQKEHVRTKLKPVAQRHHIGNVSRAKMRVEHRF